MYGGYHGKICCWSLQNFQPFQLGYLACNVLNSNAAMYTSIFGCLHVGMSSSRSNFGVSAVML